MSQHLFFPAVIIQRVGEEGWGSAPTWLSYETATPIAGGGCPQTKVNLTQAHVPFKIKPQSEAQLQSRFVTDHCSIQDLRNAIQAQTSSQEVLKHRSLNITGRNNRITTKSVLMLALQYNFAILCCVSEWLQSFVTPSSDWKWLGQATNLILKFHSASLQTVAHIVQDDLDMKVESLHSGVWCHTDTLWKSCRYRKLGKKWCGFKI